MNDPVNFMLSILGSSLAVSLLAFGFASGMFVLWSLSRGLPFGRRGQWVWHPGCPGSKVWVVRGFWDRVFKHEDYATLEEVAEYYRWRTP